MLNRTIFNRCISFILMSHDIEIDEEKNDAFYKLMANDFTDEEFQKASERICKEETLYNKYPTPPMFYKHKANRDDLCNIECQKFLDKVEDYLTLNFIPTEWKQDFINSLTETEGKALQMHGGISTLWSDCHRDEMSRSISNVLKDLKSSFNDIWTFESKVDYNAIEQQANPEIAEKTKLLLQNCLKKMGN